ncbi:coenzyme F420-0:L-glutamate ligase [Brevibacterium daeguense]|uniref:Coenzyme F420-0:L-glutamate ligase n=2 Tax=Brevibacterium daeguense TaxID=909936 RepID=A0ABP8EN11_9MICO
MGLSPSRLLTVYAVAGIGAVAPGGELAALICSAIDRDRVEIKDGDILVVASKVVAKAEGRLAQVGDRAQFEDLVAQHSHGVIAARSFSSAQGPATVAIVRTSAGTVQAAAGLDRSNADGAVVLHPSDPDAAAAQLRSGLERYFGVRLGVIVSDTTSRPWRRGVVDFALGASGVRGLDSQRGRPDDSGRTQQVTERAVADEIAAAADLVKGAARGLPVAVVRGLGDLLDSDHPGAGELNRDEAEDWFRHGHVEAVHAALGSEPAAPPASADGDDDMLTRVSRALAAARGTRARTPGQDHWRMRVTGAGSRILISPSGSGRSSEAGGHRLVEAAIGLGALVDRLHSALFAEELGARVRYTWSSNGAPSGAELTIELVMEDA